MELHNVKLTGEKPFYLYYYPTVRTKAVVVKMCRCCTGVYSNIRKGDTCTIIGALLSPLEIYQPFLVEFDGVDQGWPGDRETGLDRTRSYLYACSDTIVLAVRPCPMEAKI